jgi:hypothetical protein
LLSLNSSSKERPKESIKEEQLQKNKKNNVCHGYRGGMFNALFSHGYNRSQIIFLHSPSQIVAN